MWATSGAQFPLVAGGRDQLCHECPLDTWEVCATGARFMFYIPIPAGMRSLGFLVFALLAVTPRLDAIEQFKSLASLPLDSSPGPTLFQGQDGNLYGVLMWTDINHETTTNGAIYQLSTTGTLKYLHRFPWKSDETINATGSEPGIVMAMARDGFLYGVTEAGGLYGNGVFYRLSTNGEYTILAHLSMNYLGSGLRGCVVGPDNAIYSYHQYWGLVRLGFDGSVQVVHGPFTDEADGAAYVAIQSMKEDGSEIAVFWTKPAWRNIGDPAPRPQTVYMRILELPSLTVKESQDVDYFGAWEDTPRIFHVSKDEILAFSRIRYNPSLPGRLVSFDRSGNATLIAELTDSYISDGPLLPAIFRTLVTADGSIFFTAGYQSKGEVSGDGGTEIYSLNRNGERKQIANLNGYPLAAWCEGIDGNNLFGVSWGPVVIESSETESTSSELVTRHSVRAPLRTAAASGRHVRRAAFRYQTDPNNGNFLPIAKPDRYVFPAKPNVSSITLRVLRNDRDPELEAIELVDIASPRNGTAAIVPSAAGKPLLVSYTPNPGPRLSDTFTYSIRDAKGGTAVGEVSIRGVLTGRFRGVTLGQSPVGVTPSVSLDSLAIKVTRNGKLTGVVKVNGRSVGLSGRFGYDDIAHLSRRVRGTSDVIGVDLKLINSDGTRQLQYNVTYLGQVFEGNLPAG